MGLYKRNYPWPAEKLMVQYIIHKSVHNSSPWPSPSQQSIAAFVSIDAASFTLWLNPHHLYCDSNLAVNLVQKSRVFYEGTFYLDFKSENSRLLKCTTTVELAEYNSSLNWIKIHPLFMCILCFHKKTQTRKSSSFFEWLHKILKLKKYSSKHHSFYSIRFCVAKTPIEIFPSRNWLFLAKALNESVKNIGRLFLFCRQKAAEAQVYVATLFLH